MSVHDPGFIHPANDPTGIAASDSSLLRQFKQTESEECPECGGQISCDDGTIHCNKCEWVYDG